jgi:hypothetical protein
MMPRLLWVIACQVAMRLGTKCLSQFLQIHILEVIELPYCLFILKVTQRQW